MAIIKDGVRGRPKKRETEAKENPAFISNSFDCSPTKVKVGNPREKGTDA